MTKRCIFSDSLNVELGCRTRIWAIRTSGSKCTIAKTWTCLFCGGNTMLSDDQSWWKYWQVASHWWSIVMLSGLVPGIVKTSRRRPYCGCRQQSEFYRPVCWEDRTDPQCGSTWSQYHVTMLHDDDDRHGHGSIFRHPTALDPLLNLEITTQPNPSSVVIKS